MTDNKLCMSDPEKPVNSHNMNTIIPIMTELLCF